MFFIAGAGDSAKGFSVRYFRLLRAIIPILDDDTPEILQQRASDADMLSEYLALRAEHNRDGRRLFTRLRTLRLVLRPADGCLVCPSEDGIGEVLLLPVEAFGVAIDMVALEVFAKRDIRRGLNAEEVLRELKQTCLAGGKNAGAVHMRDVQARLLPQPSDGKVGSADAAPSLAALLYRAADDYHNLAEHGVPESII